MNRYQVILSNNEILRVLADGVNRDGAYLWFYEHVLDGAGKPKTTNDAGDLEVIKVAEFGNWNGWNYEGPYNPPEVAPKAEVKGPTPTDLAQALQDAIANSRPPV